MTLVIVQTAVLLGVLGVLGVLGYLVHKVRGLRRELRVLSKQQTATAKKLTVSLEKGNGRLEKTIGKMFSENLWPQIESLEAIGRMLDGKQFLPPTRRAAASPDLLLQVFRMIQTDSPRNIVECGSGTSTVAFAMALKAFGQAGHIYSIENDEAYAEQVREQLRERRLEDAVTLIVAPLVEKTYAGLDIPLKWYNVDKSLLPTSIDLLFVDGPEGTFQHFSRYPAGPELIPLMSPNGRVVLDDAARQEEEAMPGMWKALFPTLDVQLLGAEKGATVLRFRGDAPTQGANSNPRSTG